MSKLRIGVTGDWGNDIYSRYRPDYLLKKDHRSITDDRYYSEVVYDLPVPSGAKVVLAALKCLAELTSAKKVSPSKGEAKELPNKPQIKIVDCVPEEPTMLPIIRYLQVFTWKDLDNKHVLRIRAEKPILKAGDLKAGDDRENDVRWEKKEPDKNVDCLVIHDATRLWHESEPAAGFVLDVLSAKQQPQNGAPRVIVNLGDRLPTFKLKLDPHGNKSLKVSDEKLGVWRHLWDKRDKVMIVCSGTSLRQAGAAISRRVSWEQTIEDTIADIERFDLLGCLSQFRHVIIRFGFTGALHLGTRDDKSYARLVFMPNARGGIFRDEPDDGRIVGRNASLIASLLVQMDRNRVEFTDEHVKTALEDGLQIGMSLFDSGFPCPTREDYRNDSKGTLSALSELIGRRPLNCQN